MENFYTAQEVADLLKIKKTTVYELVKKNELPASKVGKQIRINREYLDEYLKGQVDESKTKEVFNEPTPIHAADAADSASSAREYLRSNTGMLLAGEEDFLSVFCAYYQFNEKSIPVIKQFMSCYESMCSLYFGKIHAAFVPLLSGSEKEVCDIMMPGLNLNAVRVADVRYGFYLKAGYGDKVKSFTDLAESGLRFIAGEKGSIERIIFDSALKKEAVKKKTLLLSHKECISSLQGLMCLELGQADAVIGCETNRDQFPDFDFVPMEKAGLFLLYNRKYASFDAFPAMEEVINMTAFKRRLMLTGGFDCSRCGEKLSF